MRRRDGGPATRAARIRSEHVERPFRHDAEALALSGREAPEAVVLTDRCAGLVDDRPALRREPVPTEERAVVVAGEEARLLALRAVGCVEPGARRLGAGLGLVLLAEREPDAVELARIEACEHVRLVLGRVGAAGEQPAAAMLDDAGVVAGGEPVAACATREREQLREAEAAVAANARVRRLTAGVAADERRDHGAAELLAQVEGDVREPELVARLARSQHGRG